MLECHRCHASITLDNVGIVWVIKEGMEEQKFYVCPECLKRLEAIPQTGYSQRVHITPMEVSALWGMQHASIMGDA